MQKNDSSWMFSYTTERHCIIPTIMGCRHDRGSLSYFRCIRCIYICVHTHTMFVYSQYVNNIFMHFHKYYIYMFTCIYMKICCKTLLNQPKQILNIGIGCWAIVLSFRSQGKTPSHAQGKAWNCTAVELYPAQCFPDLLQLFCIILQFW